MGRKEEKHSVERLKAGLTSIHLNEQNDRSPSFAVNNAGDEDFAVYSAFGCRKHDDTQGNLLNLLLPWIQMHFRIGLSHFP